MLTKDTVIPKVQDVVDDINSLSRSIGCFIDIENVHQYIQSKKIEMFDARKIIDEYGILNSNKSANQSLKDFIFSKNIQNYFGQTKTGALSLSESSFSNFFETYKSDDEVLILMKAWKVYADAKAGISRVEGSDEDGAGYVNIHLSNLVSQDGKRMGRVSPIYVAQYTGRFAATKPALGTIERSLVDKFITVPYGYAFVNVDMKQTDPTWYANLIFKDDLLNKFIMLDDDAYLGYIHYVRFKNGNPGFTENEKIEKTPEIIEDRQNVKRMVNKLNYGGTISNDGELGILFNKYLSNHPNRLALIDRVKTKLSVGSYIVTPYFKSIAMDVRSTDNRTIQEYGEQGLQSAHIRKTLACLIQGTTAEIMRYKYTEVKRYLEENAPKSYIIGSVHDSLKLMIYYEDIPRIKDYIDHCLEVEVEGLPLKIGCESEWRSGTYGE